MAGLMSEQLAEQLKKDAAVADAQATSSRDSSAETAQAKAAREAAAKKLRGSMGTGPKIVAASNGSGGKAAVAAVPRPVTTTDKPMNVGSHSNLVRPVKPQASNTAGHAKKAAAATPKKVAKRKGSAGEASNKDLPGRTTVSYSGGSKSTTSGPTKIHPDKPKRDVAALRAGSRQRFEEQKKHGAARLSSGGGGSDNVLRGSKSRWNARNRNK